MPPTWSYAKTDVGADSALSIIVCLGNVFNTTGHVNECPTMHFFGNPRHTQSMIALYYYGKASMILTENL